MFLLLRKSTVLLPFHLLNRTLSISQISLISIGGSHNIVTMGCTTTAHRLQSWWGNVILNIQLWDSEEGNGILQNASQRPDQYL